MRKKKLFPQSWEDQIASPNPFGKEKNVYKLLCVLSSLFFFFFFCCAYRAGFIEVQWVHGERPFYLERKVESLSEHFQHTILLNESR